MRRTLPHDLAPPGGLRAIVTGLGTAVLFAALTVLETQDKTVRAASPWQDDPYHTVVTLAAFTVPVLAVVTSLRLLAWQSPGGPDRARQMMRATGAMTALAGLTVVFEWAAVAARAHRPPASQADTTDHEQSSREAAGCLRCRQAEPRDLTFVSPEHCGCCRLASIGAGLKRGGW